MTLARAAFVLAAFLGSIGGFCGVANAQSSVTIGLAANNSATFDGLNVLISNCTYGITAGTTTSNPACSTLNDNVVLSLAGTGLSVELIGANGAALMSAAGAGAGTSNQYHDLTFNLVVTRAVTGSKTTVSSLSGAIAGSGCSTCILSHVTAGLTVTPGTLGVLPTMQLSADGTSPTTTGTLTFAPVSSLSINGDLKINLANTTNTITLNSVTQILSPAPEPASIALLATGIGGIAVSLRSRRRNVSSEAKNESSAGT